MADVRVTTNFRFVYHDPKCLVAHNTDPSILYFVYIDRSDNDLKYRKSTDGGATWGSAVSIRAGTIAACAVWADWWTPGDSGTTLHVVCLDDNVDDVFYRPLDISSDTLGTETTVYAGTTLQNSSVSITKTRGGNLVAAWNANSADRGAAKSTDSGANWSAISSPMEADQFDQIDLFAGNEADANDVWALYEDSSASQLSLKVYDDSADSWAETAIATMSANAFEHSQSGTIRHSDGHLLVSIMTGRDAATCDLLTYDINGGSSITQKTNITTDIDDMAASCIFVDQRNGDVYVSNIGKDDGSETFNTSIKTYYHKSTDGMATWGSGVAGMEGSATNVQMLFGPPMGARYIVGWMHDDSFFAYSLYVNSVVSIAMPPESVKLPPLVMAPPIGTEVII